MTTLTQPVRQAAEPGQRSWPMLTVLLLGQFMALLDVTVVNVAAPTIGVDLHASTTSLQLVIAGYTVAYAMLLITGARLGDLYGRRWMYQLGTIVFTASSLICGIAPNATILIIARFTQGIGAAVMVPQIMSVIQLRFAGKQRALALSAYGAVLSVGAVVGMVLGGVLVSANLFDTSWRPAFLVNVPIGILIIALVSRLVPADEPRGTRRLDWLGLSIAIPAISLIVLPLVLGHSQGWPAWSFGCIAAGLVLCAIFVQIEKRIAKRGGDPLLDLKVLHSPGMLSGLITLSCSMITYGGFLFIFALHLQSGLGDSALRAGLTFTPLAAAFGLMGFYWRKLPEAIHHVLPIIGLVMCVVGYLGISISLRSGEHNNPVMWISLIILGAGLGAGLSPLMAQALVHVPLPKAADASGLFTTTMQLGQVVGVATFGTLFLWFMKGSSYSSAESISTTTIWQAVLALTGLVTATALARTIRNAKHTANNTK